MGATLLSHDFYVQGEAHLCAERGWLRGNLSAAPTAIIGQKRKVQSILPGVSRVTPRAIDRCAQHFSSKRLKLIQDFVMERHLIAANRAPVRRVKCEHHRASPELAQRYRLVWCASQGEVGSLRAGTEHGAVAL
jgi:hypothetical protein